VRRNAVEVGLAPGANCAFRAISTTVCACFCAVFEAVCAGDFEAAKILVAGLMETVAVYCARHKVRARTASATTIHISFASVLYPITAAYPGSALAALAAIRLAVRVSAAAAVIRTDTAVATTVNISFNSVPQHVGAGLNRSTARWKLASGAWRLAIVADAVFVGVAWYFIVALRAVPSTIDE